MGHFGTDGVRGEWGGESLNRDIVVALAEAILELHEGPVVVLRDTRESGVEICDLLMSTLGGRGVDLGVLPTPALSVALEAKWGEVGIAVTASHNPFQDNGLKVMGPGGHKLTLAQEAKLEAKLVECLESENRRVPEGESVSRCGRELYEGRVLEMFEPGVLEGVRVAIDCANGASFRCGPSILRALGADVVELANEPDGRNINLNCGATVPATISKAVRELGVDVGVSLDGDGDRVVLALSDGSILHGDGLIFLLAKGLLDDGVACGGVVGTVMSNAALDEGVRALGLDFCRAAVGDRNIAAEMERLGWGLGGESSGHVLSRAGLPTGDGIVTALQLLSGGLDLERRLDGWSPAPQVNRSVRVTSKPPLESLPVLVEAAAEAERGSAQRVLLRYSGTESLLRVLVEAAESAEAERWAERVCEAVHASGIAVDESPRA